VPSSFSTIGVPIVGSEEQYDAWARRVAAEGRAVRAHGGDYRLLSSDAGAQLWAGLDRRGRVLGLVPHFAGAARCRARLTDRITRAGETRFEGAFDGWIVEGEPASPADSSYDELPLLFDVPDALTYADLRLPALADVQIAAFAFECTWHRDVEAYQAAQEGEGEDIRFAEQSFVYTDPFAEDPERAAIAVISALVEDTAVRVNELTGLGFRWALARTLIGNVEIVADPVVVQGEPTAGGVVHGTFWLSGRIGTVHAQADPR
jgi:hypothetical protein